MKRRRRAMGDRPLLRGGNLRPLIESAAGRSTEEEARTAKVPVRVAEVPARAAEASRSATVATLAVASAAAEPSRKRKRVSPP
jgi:hypothetical protein